MPTKPLGLNIMYSNSEPERKIGCFINEMPQFKGKILLDDILQCVFKKFLNDDKPIIAMFPYDLHRDFH